MPYVVIATAMVLTIAVWYVGFVDRAMIANLKNRELNKQA